MALETWLQPAATITAALLARIEPERRVSPQDAVALFREVELALRTASVIPATKQERPKS